MLTNDLLEVKVAGRILEPKLLSLRGLVLARSQRDAGRAGGCTGARRPGRDWRRALFLEPVQDHQAHG